MATYYVRKTGSDAAAGTSAGAAWATFGKLLGAAGMASGDTAYVGAGVYREAVTVAMTSATVTTSIIGDVDGKQTGDAGEVRLAGQLLPKTAAAGIALTLAGRDFLSFSNIVFVGAGGTSAIHGDTVNSVNITFTDCAMFNGDPNVGNGEPIRATFSADVACNWLIDRCIIVSLGSQSGILLTLTRSAVADYDVKFLVQNSVIVSSANGVSISSTGASAFFGGGVDVLNCTIFSGGGNCIRANDANLSTTIPCTIYNSLCFGGVRAATTGQVLEDYNILYGPLRINVAVGTHSVSDQSYETGVSFGQERIWGGQIRPFLSPTKDSTYLGFGSVGTGGGNTAPTVDALNRSRPSGVRIVASGTATAGAAKTLTDSGATWGTNSWAGYTLLITGGTGSGQTKSIASNTATVITVDGNWKTNPDNTSTYQVLWGDPSSTGKATAVGAVTTMTDANAAWGVNQWAGYTLSFDSGTGSPQTMVVTSNTATVLTFPTIVTVCDTTTTYSLYRATGVTTQDYTVGAYERHDVAERETSTTDAGGVGIHIVGAGDHEFVVPVDATSTTISIRARYDTAHAATNKPQAILLANGEIGVVTETKTMTSGVNTWETLTFTAFTPSAKGTVTIRLVSRSAVSNGVAFFDTVAVT